MMQPGFEIDFQETTHVDVGLPEGAAESGQELIRVAEDPARGFVVVLLGQIYYRNELRTLVPDAKLDALDDATLAKEIYIRHGRVGLERLHGEFALVVIDTTQRSLLLHRNASGSWPLYWTAQGRAIRAGTSLVSLARRYTDARVNLGHLARFLMTPFAFVELPGAETAFKGVYRVPPGAMVLLKPAEPPQTFAYWSWDSLVPTQLPADPEEAARHFLHLLSDAVTERIRRGRAGGYLSGGLDSSGVVCLADRQYVNGTVSGRLQTFSLTYQLQSLAGERDYVGMVLDQTRNVEPHEIDGDRFADFQWFDDAVPAHDEPYPGLFHLAMERGLLEAASASGVNTVVTGSGSESITQGNRLYLANLVARGRIAEALNDATRLARANNVSVRHILAQSAIRPLCPALFHDGVAPVLRNGFGRWPHVGEFTVPPWVMPGFARSHQMRSRGLESARALHRFPYDEHLRRFVVKNCVGDWASWYLAAPLGIRLSHPFQDERLIAYSLGLPRAFLEVPGDSRPLIRSALRGILPQPILERRHKRSFNEVYWRGLLCNGPRLIQMIKSSSIHDLGLFNTDILVDILHQHAAGVGDARIGGRIAGSLALICWYDRIQKTLANSPVRCPELSRAPVKYQTTPRLTERIA